MSLDNDLQDAVKALDVALEAPEADGRYPDLVMAARAVLAELRQRRARAKWVGLEDPKPDGHKPAINTNVRLFDLVRQMRRELHTEHLISNEEYAWLSSGGDGYGYEEGGGSPSPRRLEDYDKAIADVRAAILAPLPCGHPTACLTAGREVVEGVQATHWCGACAAKERPMLTQNEREIMEHALGWPKNYRNRFVTGPDTDDWKPIQELCRRGLMVGGEPSPNMGGMTTFVVTEAGIAALDLRAHEAEEVQKWAAVRVTRKAVDGVVASVLGSRCREDHVGPCRFQSRHDALVEGFLALLPAEAWRDAGNGEQPHEDVAIAYEFAPGWRK